MLVGLNKIGEYVKKTKRFKMRAILILVIALMLIFTSGCDSDFFSASFSLSSEYGKDKSEVSGAEKPSKGIAAFKSKLDTEKNIDQEPTVDKEIEAFEGEEKRRKLFEDMKRK